MINNVIFDLDGTLIDSAEDIITCLNKAFKSVKINNIPSLSRRLIGPPLREIIKKLIPNISDNDIEIILLHFRNEYDYCQFENTFLYDGVYNLLKIIKKMNISLFLFTNKPFNPTLKILNKFDILHFFSDIITIDSIPEKQLKKEDMLFHLIKSSKLGNDCTLVFSDNISDIIAAKKYSLFSAAAVYGYSDYIEVLKVKPDFIINKPLELYKLLVEL